MMRFSPIMIRNGTKKTTNVPDSRSSLTISRKSTVTTIMLNDKNPNKKKRIDDSWMSYDELSKNIIALSGDEYYRDFNIVRMNE